MAVEHLMVLLSVMAVSQGRPGVPSGSYLPGLAQEQLGYQSSLDYNSVGNFGGFGGHGGGYQQDQKHVYFFAAHDAPEYSRLHINIVPNSQRNTKIIFVKAPSYGGVVPEVIAPPSISEDKTLVYVLVKKAEHGGQITIPAGVGVRPSKPEVYFIKYQNQQDAAAAVHEGTNEQPVGTSVPDVGNESNFVNTFERDYGVGVIQPR